MSNRGEFWTPAVPWSNAGIERNGVRIAAVQAPPQMLLVSGDVDVFLRARSIEAALGPRDGISAPAYALRLAPDRALVVSESARPVALGWDAAGFAVADMTDGMIVIDVTGPGAPSLLGMGTSYDLTARDQRRQESANIVFAGLRVAVVRRGEGWRLHVERPYATALWTWLDSASASLQRMRA